MQSHHHHMPTCITLKICTHQSMVEELETIGPVDTHRWWTSYAHVYFLTFGHKPRKLGRVKSCEKNDGMEKIYPWYTVVLREVFKVLTIFHWKSKKLNEKSSQRTSLFYRNFTHKHQLHVLDPVLLPHIQEYCTLPFQILVLIIF